MTGPGRRRAGLCWCMLPVSVSEGRWSCTSRCAHTIVCSSFTDRYATLCFARLAATAAIPLRLGGGEGFVRSPYAGGCGRSGLVVPREVFRPRFPRFASVPLGPSRLGSATRVGWCRSFRVTLPGAGFACQARGHGIVVRTRTAGVAAPAVASTKRVPARSVSDPSIQEGTQLCLPYRLLVSPMLRSLICARSWTL